MGYKAIINTFRSDIDSGEFNIAALVGGEDSCDWAYSIGLHRCYGHPELLIVGLDATFTGAVLEFLGSQVAAGRTIDVGDEIRVLDGFAFRTQAVEDPWLTRGDWFILGREVMSCWGERWPQTIQLLWADDRGRFPEKPGDPQWLLRQPLLSIEHCNA